MNLGMRLIDARRRALLAIRAKRAWTPEEWAEAKVIARALGNIS